LPRENTIVACATGFVTTLPEPVERPDALVLDESHVAHVPRESAQSRPVRITDRQGPCGRTQLACRLVGRAIHAARRTMHEQDAPDTVQLDAIADAEAHQVQARVLA
jgi:hypothetical protein